MHIFISVRGELETIALFKATLFVMTGEIAPLPSSFMADAITSMLLAPCSHTVATHQSGARNSALAGWAADATFHVFRCLELVALGRLWLSAK